MTMTFCPQAIIFDMDGLLVDSEPLWGVAERAVIEARERVYDFERHSTLVGMRLDEYWSRMRTVYAITDETPLLVSEAVANMHGLIAVEMQPRPGANELIAFVGRHAIPKAIASSSPLAIIHAVVASQHWQDIFTIRVSGDQVARGKPAPDVYLEAAQQLGVETAHILALEDSVNGARAAVAAGLICYAVPDPTHAARADFDGITPFVFDSLHDVLTEIEGCFT